MTEQLESILKSLRARLFRLSVHALEEMTADDLSVRDLLDAILGKDAEIVEDYADDPRGPSCLVAGKLQTGEYAHFIVGLGKVPVVITAYRLDPKKWLDHRTRTR